MSSFVFAINAVLPIILLSVVGYFLKRLGWIEKSLVKQLNRLIFRIFLPAMLFLNVYKIENISFNQTGFIFYVVVITLSIFFLGIPLSAIFTKEADRRGVILQACFRSNHALIGLALAQSLGGEKGIQDAALLSAVIIPLFNVLAVVSLSVFKKSKKQVSFRSIIADIVKNPLIISVFLGLVAIGIRLVFARLGISFRLSHITPFMKVLEYLSSVATPLALLVLGAQFEFSAIQSLKKEIVFGTSVRVFFAPLLALAIAYLFFRNDFTPGNFAVFIAVFSTPVAVSSVPMAQEMGGNTDLAGQLVVWTTLFSAVTIFFSSFILNLLGVFS